MRGEDNSPETPGDAKEAALCGTAKNTVRVLFALNYWFHSRFRDFKKSVEVAKNQNKRS
jgi:hypothetical protein